MLRKSPIYSNKTRSLAILLVLFFVVLGSCSLKKVVSNFATVDIEIVKQVKQEAVLKSASNCSVDILMAKGGSAPLLFLAVLSGFVVTFLRTYSVSLHYLKILPWFSVPLFLRYNSLII